MKIILNKILSVIIVFTSLFFPFIQSKSQLPPPTDTTKYKVEIVGVSAEQHTDEPIFTKVEQEARFPGGVNAWTKYLSKMMMDSMKLNPNTPPGVYKIVVQFIVDKDGSLQKIEALNDYGYGLAAEAVKMIRYSPKWIPARQNKRVVKAYKKQPITIVVEED